MLLKDEDDDPGVSKASKECEQTKLFFEHVVSTHKYSFNKN